MDRYIWIVILVLVAACSTGGVDTLPEGRYRAELEAQGRAIPFLFEVYNTESGQAIDLINADERLTIEGFTFQNDTVTIPLHIFDATLTATVVDDRLVGTWTKDYYDDYVLPLTAEQSDAPRFATTAAPDFDLSGRWEVTFSSDPETPAVGEFVQNGNHITGTFLTTMGDYRFLEGVVEGNSLKLSTFDGEHAFLFEARVAPNERMLGDFFSGSHWHEDFTAVRNDTIELPDPTSLTYLKEGYEEIDFIFPGLDGNPVSLDDPKYDNKVVMLQVFGTWCPNCMDETRFLAPWYKEHKDEGVEIIGLSYERSDDFDYAVERINRVKSLLDVEYDFVVAGTSDKSAASATLPMLNAIISYPTLIILDRNHQVRRIHTGFSGPGTGHHYTEFVEDFNLFMDKLLSEDVMLAR